MIKAKLFLFRLIALLVIAATGVVLAKFQAPQLLQQPTEIELTISGDPGTPPRFAVPDFVAQSPEDEELGKILARVLWNDLAFEREFYMIPRDTYSTVPPARSVEQIPFNDWNQLGADGVIFGLLERTEDTLRVEVRLFNVRSRRSVFSKEYGGSKTNVRLYAHTIADEIHQQQRALRGVARTKITFSSDRDREKVSGTIENRNVKEVYISDYDGSNQRRITVNRKLNITPAWSPDVRSIAYTSYSKGFPDIAIARIYEGLQDNPTGSIGNNFLPAWSPDGSRIAFTSSRDGNSEIYTVNIDGSNLHRLTRHPAVDVSPAWSPTGTQIAFTSNRIGSPQIYIMSSDGLGAPRRITTNESYADRPTWSPAPFNEIAFAARTGLGYDIKIYDLATGVTRQITFSQGSNESPSYSPNGRHLAFMSTRRGPSHIFTIGRDGQGLRRVTREGNNYTPNWSQ